MKPLTPHQRQIIQFVSEGLTNKEVSERMGNSGQTVKNTLHLIYYKLGAHDRAHAVAISIRHGLLHDVERADDV